MKKFSEKINEENSEVITLNSMDNDLLNERLDYLRLEIKEISDEIHSIVSILRGRSDDTFREKLKDFPESIFDMNKEQLDYIFINDNNTTTYQHRERGKYWSQLKGFFQTGSDGEKAIFSISMSHFEDFHTGDFKIPDGFDESFEILMHCLEKDDKTSFKILCQYSDDYDWRIVVNGGEKYSFISVFLGYTNIKFKIDELHKAIKYCFNADLDNRD